MSISALESLHNSHIFVSLIFDLGSPGCNLSFLINLWSTENTYIVWLYLFCNLKGVHPTHERDLFYSLLAGLLEHTLLVLEVKP